MAKGLFLDELFPDLGMESDKGLFDTGDEDIEEEESVEDAYQRKVFIPTTEAEPPGPAVRTTPKTEEGLKLAEKGENAGWLSNLYERVRMSPARPILDGFEWWSRNVSSPLAGVAEIVGDYLTGGAFGTQEKYNRWTDKGENWWQAFGKTWNDVEGWKKIVKMIGELAFDPTSYLGFGLLGRLPGAFGRALGAADRAYLSVVAAPFTVAHTGYVKLANKMWEWIPTFTYARQVAFREAQETFNTLIRTPIQRATGLPLEKVPTKELRKFLKSNDGQHLITDVTLAAANDPTFVLTLARTGKSGLLTKELLDVLPDYSRAKLTHILGAKYQKAFAGESFDAFKARQAGAYTVIRELRALSENGTVKTALSKIQDTWSSGGVVTDELVTDIAQTLALTDTSKLKTQLTRHFSTLDAQRTALSTQEVSEFADHAAAIITGSRISEARLLTESFMAREGWWAGLGHRIAEFTDRSAMRKLHDAVDANIIQPFKEASLYSFTYDLLNLVEQSARMLDGGLAPRIIRDIESRAVGLNMPEGAYLALGEATTSGSKLQGPFKYMLHLPEVTVPTGKQWKETWESIGDTGKLYLRAIGFDKKGNLNLTAWANHAGVQASNEGTRLLAQSGYIELLEKALAKNIPDSHPYRIVEKVIEESPLSKQLPHVRELQNILKIAIAQDRPVDALNIVKKNVAKQAEMNREVRAYIATLDAPLGQLVSAALDDIVKGVKTASIKPPVGKPVFAAGERVVATGTTGRKRVFTFTAEGEYTDEFGNVWKAVEGEIVAKVTPEVGVAWDALSQVEKSRVIAGSFPTSTIREYSLRSFKDLPVAAQQILADTLGEAKKTLTSMIGGKERKFQVSTVARASQEKEDVLNNLKSVRDRLTRSVYVNSMSGPARTTNTFELVKNNIQEYWKINGKELLEIPEELAYFTNTAKSNLATMLEAIPLSNHEAWKSTYALAKDMNWYNRKKLIEGMMKQVQAHAEKQRAVVSDIKEFLHTQVGVDESFMADLDNYIELINRHVDEINSYRAAYYPGAGAGEMEFALFREEVNQRWQNMFREAAKIAPSAAIPVERAGELPKVIKTAADVGALLNADILVMPSIVKQMPYFLSEDTFVTYITRAAQRAGSAADETSLRRVYNQFLSELPEHELTKDIAGKVDEAVYDIANRMSNPITTEGAVKKLHDYIDSVSESVKQNLTQTTARPMRELRELSEKEALARYKDIFMTDEPNFIDTMMKSVFPFWMYARQILPWLVKQLYKRPVVGQMYTRYMENTDLGYLPIGNGITQVNPLRGTAGNRLRRLAQRDYPEYYAGGVYEYLDTANRFGFYLGQPFEFIQKALGAAVGTGVEASPEIFSNLPGPLQTVPDILTLFSPAKWKQPEFRQNIFFADRYKEYSRDLLLRHEAGVGMATARAALTSASPAITPELRQQLQAALSKAEGQAAIGDIISALVGFARMRPDELDDFKTRYKEILHQLRPEMTPELQDKLWARGIRPQDVLQEVLSPQEARLLSNIQGAIYSGVTRNLAPARWQYVYHQQDQYFFELDVLRRRRFTEQSEYDTQLRSGQVPADVWRDRSREIQQSYVNERTALQRHYEEQLNVPISLERRLEWLKQEGRLPPVPHPLKTLIDDFFNVELKFRNGRPDWDSFYVSRLEIEKTIPVRYRKEFYEEISANMTPTEKVEWEVRRSYLLPYWDIDNKLRATTDPQTRYIMELAQWGTADQVEWAEQTFQYKMFQQRVSQERERLIAANPLLGYWLRYFGYRTEIGLAGEQLWRQWGRKPPILREVDETTWVEHQIAYLNRIAASKGIPFTAPTPGVLSQM